MKTRSRKNKGKKLQNWVRDMFVLTSKESLGEDLSDLIKSTTMGESGADVRMFGKAREIFPYAVECKSRKSFKTLYDMYHQSDKAYGENFLVIKQNGSRPLGVMDAEYLIKVLAEGYKDGNTPNNT